MKLKFNIFIIFLLSATLALAQINVQVDRNQIYMGDIFQFQIDFKDMDKGNYVIDGIDNFNIVSRQTSTSISIINMKKTSTQSEIYILTPKKVGKFNLTVNDVNSNSNIVQVTVLDGKRPQQANNNIQNQQRNQQQNMNQMINNFFGNDPFFNEDFFGQMPQQTINQLSDEDAYIMTPKVSKKELYFGEKAIYQENFITLKPFAELRGTAAPVFNDISVTDLTKRAQNGSIESIPTKYKNMNGELFKIYNGIFQGNSSGEKEIKSSVLVVGGVRQISVGGQKLKLKVLPLPENKPENYRDIVGKLEMTSSWSDEKVSAGQSVTLKIKLFGDVNLDNISKLDIQSNNLYNVFETSTLGKISIKDGKIYSEREFEVAFIPKVEGKIRIPEIQIGYFNPATKSYETKIIPAKDLQVGSSTNSQNILPENNVANATENNLNNNSDDNNISENDEANNSTETKISIVPNNTSKNKNIFVWIGILIVVCGLGIFAYLKFKTYKLKKDIFKALELEKNPEKFYDIYVEYMKSKYNFNPLIHSETKLQEINLIDANRIMENYKYGKSLEFDREEVLGKLREE